MSQAPSMPVFWDAYLADTTHLSTEEHGAYLLLLGAMWRRNGSVPDDDRDNARITGLTPAKWRRIKARLAPLLTFSDDEITQKKLQKTWKETQEKIEKNRINGAKGGRPKTHKNNVLRLANGFAADNPNESIPEPEPEPIEERKTATQSRAGASSEVDEALAIYAEVCVPAGLSAVAVVTEKRRAAIRARLKDAKLEGWRKACHAAASSPFWRGEIPPTDGRPQFKGALDSFVRPENFAKLIEGGFAARRRVERKFDANQALFGGPA